MVKSKKMSKTGIAVIVLAILLVLSLVMGMTGAWYSAKGDAVGQNGATFTLRSSWITITGTNSAQTLAVYRDSNGDGTQTQLDAPAAVDGVIPYIVMPGDKITFSGSAASFSVSGDDAYYYVVVYDGHATTSTAIRVDADHALSLETMVSQTLTNVSNVTGSDSLAGLVAQSTDWIVNTGLTSESAGQQVASINAIAGYSLCAIQAENLTTSTAYTALKTLYGFQDPANQGG